MLPLLYEIRDHKLAELANESEFVKMIVGKFTAKYNTELVEKAVWEAIDWWKMKTIEKRPLTKDDAKAFRMITGKVKNILTK